jgi:hypothetical protein
MVEYFWRRVFEEIWEYWVNTKFPHILIFFRDENTGKVNKASKWRLGVGGGALAPERTQMYAVWSSGA